MSSNKEDSNLRHMYSHFQSKHQNHTGSHRVEDTLNISLAHRESRIFDTKTSQIVHVTQ